MTKSAKKPGGPKIEIREKSVLPKTHPNLASQAAWYRMENGPKSKNGKNLAKRKKMALGPERGKNGPQMAKR